MKKVFTLMVAAAMVFAGCKSEAGEDDGNNSGTNPDVPSLSVVPSGIPVPASGGSYDFAIASKTIWSTAITTGAAWCRISPTVGTGDATGQITVDRNTVAEARAATITFTAGALTCTTTVTQAADNPALSVDKTTINAVKAAGSYTIAVTSNTTWTVSDNADWCTVSPATGSSNGTVTINATENPTAVQRAATVTLSAGTLTRTVSVIQAAGDVILSVDKTTINAVKAAGSYTIAVTSNATWTAAVNTAATWCTVSPATGSGNGTIIVNVPANPIVAQRAATVTLSAGTLTRTVSVTQAVGDVILSVDKTTINAVKAAGSYTIAVTSNTYWLASKNSAATWCSLSNTSVIGNGTVTINVTANSTVALRAATVTLTTGSLTRTVAVTQAPNTPLYAASTQTWTFGEQIWSDVIHIPECNKAGFTYSNTIPQCRNYTHETYIWYYYNWPYVANNAAALCPSPWRVPSQSDFSMLVNPDYNFDSWAHGGNSYTPVPIGPRIGQYWSATSTGENLAAAVEVYQDYVYPWTTSCSFGMQVRCVK